jgi:hypothetical protein
MVPREGAVNRKRMNSPLAQTVGIFGVGSKRAVVALAHDVKIKTRAAGAANTFQVDLDDAWIENSDDWGLPYYKVDNIDAGTTEIELSKLRMGISDALLTELRTHVGRTYAPFLKDPRFTIYLDDKPIPRVVFSDWSFLAKFGPIDYKGTLETKDGDTVQVRLRVGLMRHSSQGGEYGVYVYCNHRFIVGAVRDESVGFVTGLLGQPHPALSLLRAELWLDGPARAMPWNSTKSAIQPGHPVFVALRVWLAQTLKEWASLSRRLVGDWQTKVLLFSSGKVAIKNVGQLPSAGRSYLPPLPQAKRGIGDRLRETNKGIAKDRPWVIGLYESMAIADIILRQRFEEKNRIALLVLDATLEIAYKEYLTNEVQGNRYGDDRLRNLFKDRVSVQAEVQKYVSLPDKVWKNASYYYDLRTKLVHERASIALSDTKIENFRETVRRILTALFGLQFVD